MITLLLGRPPGPCSVLHELHALLPAEVVIYDGEVPSADLLVLKDLAPDALREVARSGARTCNDATAELRSLDKAQVVQVLAAAGVPVPPSRVVADWADVRRAPVPCVVKPQQGTQGDGVLLLDGPAPAAATGIGPWLVQDRVQGDGVDRKLYVVGDRVLGVLRTWPAPPDRSGVTFTPDALLADVARAAACALGLEVCGVDVVLAEEGPVVVDVNAFPGFKGVPRAARVLAEHLSAAVPACA